MPDQTRRLILGNGEQYAEPIETRSRGGPREMPRSYEAARERVKTQLQSAIDRCRALPTKKRLADEVVLCLRLHPDVIAKSYDPQSFFTLVPGLVNVGSRSYRISSLEVAQTKRIKKQLEERIFETTGRLVFIRSNDVGFRRFLQVLETSEQRLPREFREDIQRVERFDTLTAASNCLGLIRIGEKVELSEKVELKLCSTLLVIRRPKKKAFPNWET